MNLPLTLSGPASGQSGGCGNVCAPSCFNEAFDIDVYGPDDQYINTSTFVWPGCNCGGLTDLSNFAIQFPPGSTADQRATLAQVEAHEWLHGWRPSALRPPPRRFGLTHTDADAALIEGIVERFGLNGEHVARSLRDGEFNHATATYLLMEERKGAP